MWLIATFPSRKYEIENYPAIKKHLLSFDIRRLEQTGKKYFINGTQILARKKTNNKWYETQDSIGYWDDFYKQKIIYPDIMRMPQRIEFLKEYPYFYLDEKNYFAEATNFIMTGKDIDLIYLFLTSELGFFAFSKYYSGPQFDATGFRYKKAYLEETFIPVISRKGVDILDESINVSKINKNIDIEMNIIWAELIGLTTKEIEFISLYKENLLGKPIINESNFIR